MAREPQHTLLHESSKHFIGGTIIGGLLVAVFLVFLGHVDVTSSIIASLVTFIITKLGDLAYIVVTDYFPRGKIPPASAETEKVTP